jgi:hypothetical protein
MTNMIKDKYLKWLRCLFEMTKMIKAINWCGITNLIFKEKINYSYEYIMTLWIFFWEPLNESKTMSSLT